MGYSRLSLNGIHYSAPEVPLFQFSVQMEMYHHLLFLKTLLLLANIPQVFSTPALSIAKALSSVTLLSAHFPCLGHLTTLWEGTAVYLENAARN